MKADDTSSLRTVRDLLRYAVSRFNEAGLSFGHGSDNAFDEAAYLILHSLHLPLDRLEPFLDASLAAAEIETTLTLINARIEKRLPASYLTNQAWLGDFQFYVDERVIVPRSHIAELLREQISPWVGDPGSVRQCLDLCTVSGCLAMLPELPSRPQPRPAVSFSRPTRLPAPKPGVRKFLVATIYSPA